MLDALLNILNGFTDIPFVELAWSHSPDDKYGVITLDTQTALNADADPVSEKMLTGFVDVFVKKPKDLSTVSDVESALKRLGIWFALESIQLEDDTGYVHYEWTWKDTTNIVSTKLYVVKFHVHNGYVGEPQIVPYGGRAVVPTDTIPDYTENGITYTPTRYWTPGTLNPVTKNTVYEKPNRAIVTIKGYGQNQRAWNDDVPFTSAQIETLISFFNRGNGIDCKFGEQTYTNATAINEERITWNVYVEYGYAPWAV